MRASRLVNLLLILQTRGGLTAAELARELEVSVRTIHRDVEALSAAGVPIYADRGPLGGIRLVDGYRTRLTGMTPDEAEALFMSGMPGPAAELGLGTVVAAARLKVLAALPTELRSRAARLVERFHLDAAGWFQVSEPVPLLAALAESVWEGRQARIDYERGDGTVSRTLGPLGLVLKGGVWYLVATSAGQIRTYRVSRVVAAEVLDERTDRPEGFELATYWTESSAAYEREIPRVKVLVRLPEDRLERLAIAVGWRAVDAAERIDDPESGWLRLRLELSWPDEVPGQLLGVGSSLEVLEPVDVRERVIATARRVLERYGREERAGAPIEGARARTTEADAVASPMPTAASVRGA
ncbi:MAG: helix-turn-helix transcriptional regulator [Candidatus Limnocylindrales bacterium]